MLITNGNTVLTNKTEWKSLKRNIVAESYDKVQLQYIQWRQILQNIQSKVQKKIKYSLKKADSEISSASSKMKLSRYEQKLSNYQKYLWNYISVPRGESEEVLSVYK